MTNKEKAMTFSSFFIIEFVDHVLKKLGDQFDAGAVALFKKLAQALKVADDPILVLEKLAQFQETNDLSIFLFDVLDRVGKIAPQESIDNLDNLSEDFINLYALMIEDDEIRNFLQVIVNEMVQEVPQEEIPQEALLTLEEFYEDELNRAFDPDFTQDDQDELKTFYSVVQQKWQEGQTYQKDFVRLVEQIREVLSPRWESLLKENALAQLPDKVKEMVRAYRQFKETHAQDFLNVLTEGALPLEPTSAEEEKSEVTVDDLLKEYYRSEVDDHIELVRSILNKPYSERAIDGIIKNFRSLKEVSMIHGYSDMEGFCDHVVAALDKNKRNVKSFNAPLQTALGNILNFLHELDKADYQLKKSGKNAEATQLIAQLEEALSKAEKVPETVKPVEQPQKAEQEAPAEGGKETLISLENRDEVFRAFKDVLTKLTTDLKPFAPEADARSFLTALNTVVSSAPWLDEHLAQTVLVPFRENYERAFAEDAVDRPQVLKALQEGWETFLRELKPDASFEESKKFWETFSIETFRSAEEKLDVSKASTEAFVESMRAGWRKLVPLLIPALMDGDEEAREKVRKFLHLLNENLRLLNLESYADLPAFLENEWMKTSKQLDDPALIEEIKQTFALYWERMAMKGPDGKATDLKEALAEVLVTKEEAPEPQAGKEAAEDELDFVQDSLAHVRNSQALLNKLKTEPENRDVLNTIASEIHAIYSAAQFMHRENIADAAIIVEETAEMFAAPDVTLPQDLPEKMEQALQSLERMVKDPKKQITEPFEALQKILDQLVLEESVPEEGPQEKEAIEGEAATVEEKPLFSGQSMEDEELREIFKADAQDLLKTLNAANQTLLLNPVDEEKIREFDQAINALKNAAKMTGLNDLALVFSRLEEISEQLKENPSVSTKDVQTQIAEFLKKVPDLIEHPELDAQELSATLAHLDALTAEVANQQKNEKAREKRLRNLFVEEAHELLQKINHSLIELEKVPESSTILAELLRHLHTLKGGAMMANFGKIGELAHKLEDYFQLYRNQNAEKKLELLPTAFTIIDLISEMVRSVEQGDSELVSQFTARLADIDNKLFYLKDFDIPQEITETVPPASARKKEPPAVQETDNTIKIKSSYVDHLVNLATELVVARTELASHFEALRRLNGDLENQKKFIRHFVHQFEDFLDESAFGDLKNLPPALEQDYEVLRKFLENFKNISTEVSEGYGTLNRITRLLEKNIAQLSVLSKSLHGDLLKARMVPIRLLFERFERPVRDLARKQRKQVELIMEDNGAELDRALVDALYEPLLHILRNAVDHGIEKVSQRKKARKEPKGKIILRARQEKGQVVIDIIDDGQGIDLEKIRSKIVDLKLATKKEAAQMSEGRLLEYIFQPDFSTSDKATDVSGRGIGLDVVVAEIQKLKGIVRVKTVPGRGTTFSIRVPLTLIVSQAMLIKFHDQTVAVPLVAVMESLEVSEESILLDDQRSYVQVRGKLLPYVDIDDMLKIPGEAYEKKPKRNAIVLHDSGVSIVLGIEEIQGRQDIVIKSLGNMLQNVELISGGTILTNGEVGLILDYAALIHKVETEFFASLREQQLVRKIISPKRERKLTETEGFIDQGEIAPTIIRNREPVILVVDDAMSVREFISAFLERNGFKILKAANGKEALEMAKENEIDLLITDLEMPVMHGFDLIKQLRNTEKYEELPIIILTAQAGKNFQKKGAEAGANAFISKPFKEGDLLRMINAFIKVQ